MNTPEPTAPVRITARGRLLPLYAAGFVTAFGAHSIAASLGGYTHAQHASLLTLGRAVGRLRRRRGRPQTGVRVTGRPGWRPPGAAGWPARVRCRLRRVRGCRRPGLGRAREVRAGCRRCRVLPGGRGAGRAAYPKYRAGPGVRPLRRLERPGLHPGPGPRWRAHCGRRLSSAVHHPGAARCCRCWLGCAGGACGATASSHPADGGRSCPPTHQPRLRAANPGAGRRHRRPVGRRGVPASGGRHARSGAVGYRARSCRCWPRPPP